MYIQGLIAVGLLLGAAGAPVPPPPARWSTAVTGSISCTVTYAPLGSRRTLAIEAFPTSPEVLLIIANAEHEPSPQQEDATITLGSGEAFSASVIKQYHFPPGTLTYIVRGLPATFADALGRSVSLKVAKGNTVLIDRSIPPTGEALKTLRSCADEKSRSWGVDPIARAALQRPPEPIGGLTSWFSDSDYPREALQNDVGGRVIMRVDVAASGAVAGCEVVVGSGHHALDVQSCSVVRERGRFQPALDKSGEPVAFSHIGSVVWAIAE